MLMAWHVATLFSIGILSSVVDASSASFVAPNASISGGVRSKYSPHRGSHHGVRSLRNGPPREDAMRRRRDAECSRRTSLLPAPPNRRGRSRLLAVSPLAGAPSASSSACPNVVVAGSALLLSSLSGVLFERNASGSNGGHVVTLLAAAFLSNVSRVVSRAKMGANLPCVPVDHFLYDWCWSVFLPASLVFALLSSPSSSAASSTISAGSSSKISAASSSHENNESAPKSTSILTPTKSTAIRRTILGMALPFLAGSVGSVLGCLASFRCVATPYPKRVNVLLAGCLCASYIGGTVNFFATAKVLRDGAGGGDADVGSAFGSMAAADLVAMAFYFAALSGASRSRRLRRLFPSELGDGVGVEGERGETRGDDDRSEHAHDEDQSAAIETATETSNWPTFTAAVLASSVAVASVLLATRLEERVANSFPPPFNPPGTMCAFLAAIGLTSERLMGITLARMTKKAREAEARGSSTSSSPVSAHLAEALRRTSAVSPSLSDACFHLLFAAVGTTADLPSAVAGGPAALAFASSALIVHAATVVGVTSAGVRLGETMRAITKKMGVRGTPAKSEEIRRPRWPRPSWEEVLTASNAAIGGPSTAAAFAAGLVPGDDGGATERGDVDRGRYRSALVVAATFWGVLGYAIATGVGVTLSRILMR